MVEVDVYRVFFFIFHVLVSTHKKMSTHVGDGRRT